MKGSAGLAAGACVALAIACAGSPGPMSATSPTTVSPSTEHDQIEQLAARIDHARTQMQLPPPGGAATPMSVGAPPACVRVSTDTCTQTCTLADSICDNSKKICEIADKLNGDTWAEQKCSESQATCTAATRRCCECT